MRETLEKGFNLLMTGKWVVNRKAKTAISKINKRYHWRTRNNKGVDIMSADWDNLLILDACRYDTFKSQFEFGTDLEFKYSKGSHTREFLRENFAGQTHYDTVYISATPQVSRVEGSFHHVEHLWKENWNGTLHTVLPETVEARALELSKKFPNKRLIIHFIQPHYPFVGPTGKKIPHRTLSGSGQINDDTGTDKSVWELLKDEEIDRETVQDAYQENLDVVLPSVQRLLDKLVGKSVVTADHGNSFGNWDYPIPRKIYGHPDHVHIDQLVKIPWLELEDGDRKKITAGESNNSRSDGENDKVSQRLKHLGYK